MQNNMKQKVHMKKELINSGFEIIDKLSQFTDKQKCLLVTALMNRRPVIKINILLL